MRDLYSKRGAPVTKAFIGLFNSHSDLRNYYGDGPYILYGFIFDVISSDPKKSQNIYQRYFPCVFQTFFCIRLNLHTTLNNANYSPKVIVLGKVGNNLDLGTLFIPLTTVNVK